MQKRSDKDAALLLLQAVFVEKFCNLGGCLWLSRRSSRDNVLESTFSVAIVTDQHRLRGTPNNILFLMHAGSMGNGKAASEETLANSPDWFFTIQHSR